MDWKVFFNTKFLCLLPKENEQQRGKGMTSKAFPGAIFFLPACGLVNVKLDGQAIGIKWLLIFPATNLLIFWLKKQVFPPPLSEEKVSERSPDMWPLPPTLLAFLPL